MQIQRAMLSILAPPLEASGFEYTGKSYGASWRFRRVVGSTVQFITVVKSNHAPRGLGLLFGTSVSPIHWPANALVPGREADQWWLFEENEESLRAVLNSLVDVIVDYGFPWFEAHTQPSE